MELNFSTLSKTDCTVQTSEKWKAIPIEIEDLGNYIIFWQQFTKQKVVDILEDANRDQNVPFWMLIKDLSPELSKPVATWPLHF